MRRSFPRALAALLLATVLICASTALLAADRDHDGIDNSIDNCLIVPNYSQQDSDFDGVGDACDYSESGQGDVRVVLNGGANVVFVGEDNIIEFWIANGEIMRGIGQGFEFNASFPIQWVTDYGTLPTSGPYRGIIKEHGDVIGVDWWSGLLVLTTHLPDSLAFGGAGIVGMPPHDSHSLCYSMKFRLTNSAPTSGGFCIDNIFVPPGATWTFNEDGLIAFAPNYQGKVNSTEVNPDAPAVCFDIVQRGYVRGDADGNVIVTISDAVYLINYIFSGGPAPSHLEAADADCNGLVTISDAVYLINYIFAGGPAPC